MRSAGAELYRHVHGDHRRRRRRSSSPATRRFSAAPERARGEAGGAIAACFAAEVGCALDDGERRAADAPPTARCAAAATALAAARATFRDEFPTRLRRTSARRAGVWRSASADQLRACAADGLPTTTLGDLADCVFRDAVCPVTRALGELAAGGAASLARRGALPAELACAAIP